MVASYQHYLRRQEAASNMVENYTSGKHYKVAQEGHLYHAITAVAGVAPGTAIGTTAAFALYNPGASNKDLVILRATMSYVSGTLGIGVVDWVAHTNPGAAAVTGTAIPAVNANFLGAAAWGRPLTTATVVIGQVCRAFANLPPALASSVLTPWLLVDEVDGAIIVPPGCSVTLEATAAGGSSPLVRYGVTWEEVPHRD